jgi:hypothetical protein
MTPGTFNFIIDRGVKFGPFTLTCKDATGSAGVAVNLTGWTVYADARSRGGVFAFSLGAEITTAASGKVTIVMTDEETDALTAGHYTYDLVFENASGERLGPYMSGTIEVNTLNTQPA